MKTTRRCFPGGFTLVELLVVITIIGVLASLLMPQMRRSIERAHRTACMNNLRQIGVALLTYAHESEGRFPYTGLASDSANKHLALLMPRWVGNGGIFICRSALPRGYHADSSPMENRTRGELRPGTVCFAYAFGLGAPGTEEFPLACDQLSVTAVGTQQWAHQGLGSNHNEDGGNVLYLDGRVEFLAAAAQGLWPANKPKLRAWEKGQWRDPANAERSPED